MRRFILSLIVGLAVICGPALADEGVIVSARNGILSVKVGDKDVKIFLRDLKVLDAEGKELKGEAKGKALKKDTKIEFTEKDGKVTEIKLKK